MGAIYRLSVPWIIEAAVLAVSSICYGVYGHHGEWACAGWVAMTLMMFAMWRSVERDYLALAGLVSRCRWADRTDGTSPVEEDRVVREMVEEFDSEVKEMGNGGHFQDIQEKRERLAGVCHGQEDHVCQGVDMESCEGDVRGIQREPDGGAAAPGDKDGDGKRMRGHLAVALSVAVPLHVSSILAKGGPDRDDMERAKALSGELASRGDVLLFGGKKGEAAAMFNEVARAIAVMSFCRGGVTLFGEHWEFTR